ncbi:CHAP domain-containing protein [Kitasatospora aureofaciens]|uniref:CHAP domain-containing protein n=1 Tax=Kitasatospora aureofaciens TaxID=1894 RepID=UPI00068F4053|nr:CHAP domain-containing protein [Kitasatospora aureofaciens]
MPKKTSRRLLATAVAAGTLVPALMLGAQSASASVGSTIVGIAANNIGKGACDTNSAGGTGFYSSCSGGPEAWCADFAKWVWSQDGVDVSGLTPAAGSFGQYNGGLHSTPHVGDAVLFNYNGAGYADHVALVTAVNADGTINDIGGNQGGVRGNWSATSHVTANTHFNGTVGSYLGGQRISGYVSPIGGRDASTPPPPPAPPTKNNRVIETVEGGALHEVYTDAAGWHDNAVPGIPGNINALGFSYDSTGARVVEAAEDGVLHEIYTDPAGGWHDNTVPGIGTGISALAFSYSPQGNRVIEAVENGSLHEIYSDPDGTWHDNAVPGVGGGITALGFRRTEAA